MERADLRDLLIAVLLTALPAPAATPLAAGRLQESQETPDPRDKAKAALLILATEVGAEAPDPTTIERASRLVIEAFMSDDAIARFADGHLDLRPIMARLDDDSTLQSNLLECGVNLATVQLYYGEPEFAQRVAEAVYACISRDAARHRNLAVDARTIIVGARKKLGDIEGAFQLETEIHDALDEDSKKEDVETAKLNLGDSLGQLGRFDEAIELQQQALQSMRHREAKPKEVLEARLMLLKTIFRSAGSVSSPKDRIAKLAEAGDGFAEIVRDLEARDLPARDHLMILACSSLATSDFYRGRIDPALERFNDLLAALPQDEAASAVEREHWLQSIASLKFAKGDITAARSDMLRAIELAGGRMQAMQTRSRRAQEAVGREIAQLVWSLLSCRDFAVADRKQDAVDLETVVRFRSSTTAQTRIGARIATRIAAGDAATARLLDRVREARMRIATASSEPARASLRDAEETAERELFGHVGVAGASPVELGALARALPADAAAILVMSYQRYQAMVEGKGMPAPQARFTAFVLSRDAVVHRLELGEAASIVKSVRQMRRILRAMRDRPGEDPNGYPMPPSLAPVFEVLPRGVSTLFVCPDAELAEVPWEMMAWPSGETVANRYRVIYGQNLDALLPPEPCTAPPALLAVGDVDYGESGTWPPLRNSLAEVAAVEALFAGRHPQASHKTVTRANADKATVVEAIPGFRFLHLVTHGFAKERKQLPPQSNPFLGALADPTRLAQRELDTGLVFANANTAGSQAVLTAAEILALDLSQCELAVLSACSTNAGQRHPGEAVAGLNRALQLAGAHATITSLWEVDDAAAKLFFVTFYASLWGEPAHGVVDAFAEAQRAVRNAGFMDWGAFVLYAPLAGTH